MPNPIPGCWYWHKDLGPVKVKRIGPDGLVHYDALVSNGSEWPSAARGTGLASEFDPWPIRGLRSESLMETKSPGE